jgi:ABC-type Fe3+ transport system permease subunit
VSHNGKSREDLAQEANQVRSKLFRTVEQLDQRRHQAFDLRIQLERHVRQAAIGAGLLLVTTAGAVAVVVYRITTAAQRRRRSRWHLAKEVWQHPERALHAERRSFFRDVGRSLLMSVVTTAVTIPARRAVAMLMERKSESPAR